MRERMRSALVIAMRHVPAIHDRDLLVLAVLLGVAGGVSEAAGSIVRYWILHQAAGEWVSGEVYWMAPLAASTVFLCIAGTTILVRHCAGLSNSVNGVALCILSALCVYSVVRSVSGAIHPVALWLLAIGSAVQVGRVASRFSNRSLTRIRIALAIAVVLLTLWGVAQPLRTASHNELQAPAAAKAAGSERPNVVLIVWDTVRARNLSLYGYERQTTPNLDKLAKQAAVFKTAITTASWTLPAHASLFTARYHHEHSADRESPLDETFPTLAEVLRDQGYRTAGFVANTYWVGRGFGLDRGFEYYEDQLRVTPEAVFMSWWMTKTFRGKVWKMFGNHQAGLRISAATITASLLRWVDKGHRPFFAFVNMFDAHEPYFPSDDFGFRFAAETPRYYWDYKRAERFSESELSQMRAAYDSCIYYLDHQLGLLLTELHQRRVLDNTIVIVTADHGETLGEHQPDLLGHENNVYYDVLHVPLVIWYPRLVPAGASGTLVSLADIPATVMDLVHSGPSTHPFPGTSLLRVVEAREASGQHRRVLASQANPAEWHRRKSLASWPIGDGPLYSLVDGSLHYIVNARRTEQLFDLESDPWERHDFSGSPRAQGALDRFRGERRNLLTGTRAKSVPAQAAQR